MKLLEVFPLMKSGARKSPPILINFLIFQSTNHVYYLVYLDTAYAKINKSLLSL